MKPPPQKQEGTPLAGANGRKSSFSQSGGNPYNLTSPSSGRPGTRRRESIDPSPFSAGVTSPTTAGNNRFGRDEGSPWFVRRGAEIRESERTDADNDDSAKDPSPSK